MSANFPVFVFFVSSLRVIRSQQFILGVLVVLSCLLSIRSIDSDHRSLRHSDWFKLKMIMAFSFNILFPRIPQLPPKTQFVKIKFINQGLDLLNISNIFRDHRVAS